ncbi:type 1 periplasmic-binding domain-containing protein [Paraburkholderia gardini]|uniref:Uncharacterized protein n=1 Tax=Paraburkholderia gardini TaxID=2823469 RepID=A0ABM8U3J8_9BURK|nr:hypothetical protein [Paraburkholderia gardini]CAG4898689.1 hypothetical protein R54767_02425 [Paraburkholderia gardini]
MKCTHFRRPQQHGQAMTEFLVATALVMGVLLLAVATLGKFNDVRNKTLMGARYVAWERTVWDNGATMDSSPATSGDDDWYSQYGSGTQQPAKSDIELQREVIQRMLAQNGAPIAGDDRLNNRLPAVAPAMWEDHGGHAFLGATDDVVVSSNRGESPAANLAQYSAEPFGSMSTSGSGTFNASMNLATRNLQTGTLSVSIAKDSDALRNIWPGFGGLTFSDTNVVLANTWLSEGAAKGEHLFTAATPAANASLVSPSLYMGLKKYAPEIDTLQFGRIERDVVPADRLSP